MCVVSLNGFVQVGYVSFSCYLISIWGPWVKTLPAELVAVDDDDAKELAKDFADEKVCSTFAPLFSPVE